MSEFFEKSMRTLELPAVLQMLAEEAVTEEGKEKCLSLRPSTDAAEVQRALDETSAAWDMLMQKGSPTFSGVRPVTDILHRADMGGSLNTRELLNVARVLNAARRNQDYHVYKQETATCIDSIFNRLHANKFLEESITHAIPDEETISDGASSELADIRRHIRGMASKVRDILQKLITSNQSRYLQENIITMRGGRYVVPVKAEYKNEIQGLVHDVSASGGTYFIEPLSVVKANNELRELQAKEEQEIERILAELSSEVAAHRDEIEEDYRTLIQLDVIFAKANLSIKMKGCAPKISSTRIDLIGARHPLLDPVKAVANHLMLGGDYDTLVITGPNTGGKTVTLKTFGLLSLMAQCGLHLPVKDNSYIRVFRNILADVGDEQSIEQSLSTFSAHMANIISILKETDHDSLVLFDELGAGTDPVEGAALAEAILEKTREAGALVAATTHYAELKIYAMSTPGVENASCEFNVETLAPTYRLLIGIPGKSNAFAISKRLGLEEEVIERASAKLNSESVRFEDVLAKLDEQRQKMEREREEAERLKKQAEEEEKRAAAYERQLRETRDKAEEKARAEAREILREARAASDLVLNELKDMQKHRDFDAQRLNERRTEMRRILNETENKIQSGEQVQTEEPYTRDAVVGDTVRLLTMGGVTGTVVAVGSDGTLQVRAGSLNISVKQNEARVTQEEKPKSKKRTAARSGSSFSAAVPPEIDLRGMTTDEAVAALEQYLDSAVMGKLTEVTVIHGKGTGAVRSAVQQYLKRSRYVKSFRIGRYGEGDNGVTVVTLK